MIKFLSPALESLIAGGSIDELTGTLISALMGGEPKDKILDIFFNKEVVTCEGSYGIF